MESASKGTKFTVYIAAETVSIGPDAGCEAVRTMENLPDFKIEKSKTDLIGGVCVDIVFDEPIGERLATLLKAVEKLSSGQDGLYSALKFEGWTL